MNPNRYEEVESLREDGVLVVITRRLDSGHLSFRIQKEFEKDGEVKATAYLGPRHVPALERLVRKAKDRMDILTDEYRVSRARRRK